MKLKMEENIMNRLSRQVLLAVIGCTCFIALMGTVGTYEYADEVVYNMPEEVYYTILDTLGDDATEKAIAAEYMSNREFYDNLNK